MRSAAVVLALASMTTVAVADGKKAPGKPAPKTPKPAPAPKPDPVPEPVAPVEVKPWANGVSADDQHKAEAIFAEANQLFSEQSYVPALEKYKEALAVWNHPLIRFNMAVALIRLQKTIEAADELEKSFAFGQAPFKPELYQQALDYKTLLASQIGELEVSCDAAGESILLDGKHWFDCPKSQKQRMLVGEHTIVGERAGFLTASKRVVVKGNAVAKEKIDLVSLDSAVKLEYPYRRWIPWTITAVGAAVALGGIGFYFVGKNEMNEFDANFARECTITGCEKGLGDHPSLKAQEDAAILKRTVGFSMMIAGGAVTVGGLVMTIMNRPKRVLPHVDVAPTRGGAAASLTVHW